MNRRDFLKATAGLAAGAAVPAGPGPVIGVDLAAGPDRMAEFGLVRSMVEAQQVVNGNYFAFLSPRQYRDLLDMEARDRWRRAYRAFRVHCRECGMRFRMDPYDVLRDFGKSKVGLREGELGRFEGIKIIESPLYFDGPAPTFRRILP